MAKGLEFKTIGTNCEQAVDTENKIVYIRVNYSDPVAHGYKPKIKDGVEVQTFGPGTGRINFSNGDGKVIYGSVLLFSRDANTQKAKQELVQKISEKDALIAKLQAELDKQCKK